MSQTGQRGGIHSTVIFHATHRNKIYLCLYLSLSCVLQGSSLGLDGVCYYSPHTRPINATIFPSLPSSCNYLYTASYDGSVRCLDLEKEVFTEVRCIVANMMAGTLCLGQTSCQSFHTHHLLSAHNAFAWGANGMCRHMSCSHSLMLVCVWPNVVTEVGFVPLRMCPDIVTSSLHPTVLIYFQPTMPSLHVYSALVLTPVTFQHVCPWCLSCTGVW